MSSTVSQITHINKVASSDRTHGKFLPHTQAFNEKQTSMEPQAPKSKHADTHSEELDKEAIKQKVTQYSEHLQDVSRELNFQVGENEQDIVVEVFDSTTNELIRRIPAGDIIDLIEQNSQFDAASMVDLRI